MASTKSILNSIGGMQTIANHLGDDFLLGRQIAAAGKEVRLSHYLVETSTDADHLGGMLRHQIRWARGTRACRPGGYLGLILTYGTATSLGNAMLAGFSKASLVLFFGVLLVRGLVAWRIGVHWIQDRILKRFFWLVPLRDLLSFYIWLMSLGGRQVEWRGIRYTLAEDGRITVIGKVDASR
jgi:ceramide glucosyltransferase